MITQLNKIEQMVGKTIKHIKSWAVSDILIVFTDNTGIILVAEGNEDYNSFEVEDIHIFRFPREMNIEMEICTAEEYDAEYQRRVVEIEEREKKSRREQFEKLKKEFESEGR